MKNKAGMAIYNSFMSKSPSDFLGPTKTMIFASFVFVLGFFCLYYSGFVDTINTYLIGNPVEYSDSTTPYVVDVANPWSFDPWGIGLGLQAGFFAGFSVLFVHFLASFVSWIFYKRTKK